MDRILNFELFKEKCSKFNKPSLKALLWNWAFQRSLTELVLVNAINSCDKNGKPTPKNQSKNNYVNTVKGERILILLLGRKESAKVYGKFEGVTSDMKTVDYVLSDDVFQFLNIEKRARARALNCVSGEYVIDDVPETTIF